MATFRWQVYPSIPLSLGTPLSLWMPLTDVLYTYLVEAFKHKASKLQAQVSYGPRLFVDVFDDKSLILLAIQIQS